MLTFKKVYRHARLHPLWQRSGRLDWRLSLFECCGPWSLLSRQENVLWKFGKSRPYRIKLNIHYNTIHFVGRPLLHHESSFWFHASWLSWWYFCVCTAWEPRKTSSPCLWCYQPHRISCSSVGKTHIQTKKIRKKIEWIESVVSYWLSLNSGNKRGKNQTTCLLVMMCHIGILI